MSLEMSQWSFKLSYYNEHKSYLRHVNVDNKVLKIKQINPLPIIPAFHSLELLKLPPL